MNYNRDLDKLPKDIFYIDKEQNWKVNPMGYTRLLKDNKFAEFMLDEFKLDYKFAFIYIQLGWLGLSDTFNEANLIEDVVDNDDTDKLDKELEKIFNEEIIYLTAKDRTPLIELIGLIDKHNSKLKDSEDGTKLTNIKYVKNINSLNGYLEEVGSAYRVDDKFTKTINGKRYKQPWRLVKIQYVP